MKEIETCSKERNLPFHRKVSIHTNTREQKKHSDPKGTEGTHLRSLSRLSCHCLSPSRHGLIPSHESTRTRSPPSSSDRWQICDFKVHLGDKNQLHPFRLQHQNKVLAFPNLEGMAQISQEKDNQFDNWVTLAWIYSVLFVIDWLGSRS